MNSASGGYDLLIALCKWGAVFLIAVILREPLRSLLDRIIELKIGPASAKLKQTGEAAATPVTGGPAPTLPEPQELSEEAKKILGTLWFHQKKHFGDERSKIWTFEVLPNTTNYPIYLDGLNQLVQKGLTLVLPETHHCALTSRGYDYCHEHEEQLPKDREIYRWD